MRWQLQEHILCLSNAASWKQAVKEWEVTRTWWEDEPGRCVCSHYPIYEHCELSNLENGLTTIVGNCCVKLFVAGTPRLFAAIDRIRDNPQAAPNAELISYAAKQGLVSLWELKFLQETKRKRRLSWRQMTKRLELNRKILSRLGAVPAGS